MAVQLALCYWCYYLNGFSNEASQLLCPSWCFESMKLLTFIQSACLSPLPHVLSMAESSLSLLFLRSQDQWCYLDLFLLESLFEKMKSIAIGEGTNATEREENRVSWNLFHLSLSYLNAAKRKSDVNLVVVNSRTGRESSQPERRRRRVGSIQGSSSTLC